MVNKRSREDEEQDQTLLRAEKRTRYTLGNHPAGSNVHSSVLLAGWAPGMIARAKENHISRIKKLNIAVQDWNSGRSERSSSSQHNSLFQPLKVHRQVGVRLDQSQVSAIAAAIRGKSIFLTGSAGSGKSFTLNSIVQQLRKRGKQVAVTGSTGCAATLLNGITIHSFLNLGFGQVEISQLRKQAKRNMKLRNKLLRTDTLIIDEISMIDGDLFDKIEAVCSATKESQTRNNGVYSYEKKESRKAFGGLQVVLCGDFFQLPPVGSRSSPVAKTFAFQSDAWNNIVEETHVLNTVHRQSFRPFVKILEEIRVGQVQPDTKKVLEALVVDKNYLDVGEVSPRGNPLHFTKIFPYRSQVNCENRLQLSKLDGFTIRYLSSSYCPAKPKKKIEGGKSENAHLDLKSESVVICTKNISPELGIINGSAGKVLGFVRVDNRFKKVSERLLNEDDMEKMQSAGFISVVDRTTFLVPADTACVLPLVVFENGEMKVMKPSTWDTLDTSGNVVLREVQVPLVLGWALSVHKSQGMSLLRVETDLSVLFDYGQGYVALSRCSTLEGLRLRGLNVQNIKAHPKVRQFYGISNTAPLSK